MTNLIGADVSFYQDKPDTVRTIDFSKMKSNGASFVIIRAGQNTWEDTKFDVSWKNSKGILPRGSYWFYDSRVDPKTQAKLWITILGNDLGELPLWCDFEDRYGGSFGTWKHWYDFIEELKRLAPGKAIGIYTGYYYWIEHTVSVQIPTQSLNYFKQFPLWVANYGVTSPLVPKPWDTWTLWQYTDSGNGSSYGVESHEIDLNYFNGDLEKFNKTFSVDSSIELPPVVEEKDIMIYTATTLNSGLRVRTDHTTFATAITTVASANSVLTASDKWVATSDGSEVKAGDIWLYVTHVNGNQLATPGWCAYKHKGILYCKDLKELSGETPVQPSIFPDSFTLTDSNGARAEYKFVRIVE